MFGNFSNRLFLDFVLLMELDVQTSEKDHSFLLKQTINNDKMQKNRESDAEFFPSFLVWSWGLSVLYNSVLLTDLIFEIVEFNKES